MRALQVRTDGSAGAGERMAVRSDRVLTLGVEEERTRNAEMAAFAGTWAVRAGAVRLHGCTGAGMSSSRCRGYHASLPSPLTA